jgi:hypothetical protein
MNAPIKFLIFTTHYYGAGATLQAAKAALRTAGGSTTDRAGSITLYFDTETHITGNCAINGPSWETVPARIFSGRGPLLKRAGKIGDSYPAEGAEQ